MELKAPQQRAFVHRVIEIGQGCQGGNQVDPMRGDRGRPTWRASGGFPIGSVGTLKPRPSLVDAWTEFLDEWEWAWFCSFTFRDPVHPEQADRRYRRFVYEMNRTLYPYRLKKSKSGREELELKGEEGVYWARCMEWQRRGVLHYHALMGGVGTLRRLSWMDRWNEMAGFAKIEPPASPDAVRRYCAKYVAKGSHLGEIDLGGRLTRFKPFIPRLAG